MVVFKLKQFLREWGLFILCMLFFLLTRIFLWHPMTVEGHSMDPTLQDGEKLIMFLHTSIQRFDIVVAEETEEDGTKTQIVKRVIGLPGDTVSYKDDRLFINGKALEEPYLKAYKAAFQKDKLQKIYSYNGYFQDLADRSPSFTAKNFKSDFTVKVPKGQYFLLGDDRIVSSDSRHVGNFSRRQITGEVKFRYWPLNHLRGF